MELLDDLSLTMDRSTIEEEQQGVLIQSSCCLCEEISYELQQHILIDSFPSLLWSIDDGWQSSVAGAACDHIVASRIFRSGRGLDVGRLAWKEDGIGIHVSLTLVSLIEEEDVAGADALQLASHLSDLLTHLRRH